MLRPLRICLAAGFGSALLGCDDGRWAAPGGPQTGPVTVEWGALRQHISGFGASSAWTAPAIDDALADQFFSVESGIGLSLLRLRIAPDGTTGETTTAQQALARGARVWAAPWSPPAEWKSEPPAALARGGGLWGGSLLPEYYTAWAERLADFVTGLADEGVPLLALSAQNEPDYEAEWETCRWTPETLQTFIADHLAPALAERDVDTSLLAPEASGWNSIARYADPLLEEPSTRDAVAFVATHDYNGTPFDYETPFEHDKELWMTEGSADEAEGQSGMSLGIHVARTLHDSLTYANVNAFHYWWLLPRTDFGLGVDSPGALSIAVADSGDPPVRFELTPRAYVLGNYSRFIRPGSYRLETEGGEAGVYATAFQGADPAELVIVAINANTRVAEQRFELSGATPAELVPWLTSESAVLEAQPAIELDAAESGSAFDYELPALSVTTFVGRVEGS